MEECSPDQLLVLFVISWCQCTCTLLPKEAFWSIFNQILSALGFAGALSWSMECVAGSGWSEIDEEAG